MEALSHLPRVQLKNEAETRHWRYGRKITATREFYQPAPNNLTSEKKEKEINKTVIVLNHENAIEGIAIMENFKMLIPQIVFNAIG